MTLFSARAHADSQGHSLLEDDLIAMNVMI